jgi:DNA-binding response OmpR family regulator
MKILIVEDDSSMVDLYKVWLRSTKAEIDYCDNSFDVSDKIKSGSINNYDLLIVDLKLQGSEDGDKVVDQLSEMEFEKKEKTPILFLGGDISEEMVQKYGEKRNIRLLKKTSVSSEILRNQILEVIAGL